MLENLSNNDQLLIQRIREEDQKAFKTLFEKYRDRLFAVAVNRLRTKYLAEDIAQQLFADLWSRRQTLEITTSVPAYLFSALKYLIINHAKKKSRRPKYVDIIAKQYETNAFLPKTKSSISSSVMS